MKRITESLGIILMSIVVSTCLVVAVIGMGCRRAFKVMGEGNE